MTTPNQAILAAANVFCVDPALLLSKIQTREAVEPRDVAAWLLTQKLHLSSPDAGRELGGRDHTTILHSLKKVRARRETDPSYDGLINSLEYNLDLLDRLEGLSVMNIITIARHASMSRRGAMALTVHETMAMANTLLELWEVTQAAGVLAEHVIQVGNPLTIETLAVAIRDQLALLTEVQEKPQLENEETTNVE